MDEDCLEFLGIKVTPDKTAEAASKKRTSDSDEAGNESKNKKQKHDKMRDIHGNLEDWDGRETERDINGNLVMVDEHNNMYTKDGYRLCYDGDDIVPAIVDKYGNLVPADPERRGEDPDESEGENEFDE